MIAVAAAAAFAATVGTDTPRIVAQNGQATDQPYVKRSVE
jgi:hypothetical protein